MISEFSKIISLLQRINTSVDSNLISDEEVKEAHEAIIWLQERQEILKKIVNQYTHYHTFSTQEITKILADLGQEVGDMEQCLEDIYELLTTVTQRYVQFINTQHPKLNK